MPANGGGSILEVLGELVGVACRHRAGGVPNQRSARSLAVAEVVADAREGVAKVMDADLGHPNGLSAPIPGAGGILPAAQDKIILPVHRAHVGHDLRAEVDRLGPDALRALVVLQTDDAGIQIDVRPGQGGDFLGRVSSDFARPHPGAQQDRDEGSGLPGLTGLPKVGAKGDHLVVGQPDPTMCRLGSVLASDGVGHLVAQTP